jgi:hypothetical protein
VIIESDYFFEDVVDGFIAVSDNIIEVHDQIKAYSEKKIDYSQTIEERYLFEIQDRIKQALSSIEGKVSIQDIVEIVYNELERIYMAESGTKLPVYNPAKKMIKSMVKHILRFSQKSIELIALYLVITVLIVFIFSCAKYQLRIGCLECINSFIHSIKKYDIILVSINTIMYLINIRLTNYMTGLYFDLKCLLNSIRNIIRYYRNKRKFLDEKAVVAELIQTYKEIREKKYGDKNSEEYDIKAFLEAHTIIMDKYSYYDFEDGMQILQRARYCMVSSE